MGFLAIGLIVVGVLILALAGLQLLLAAVDAARGRGAPRGVAGRLLYGGAAAGAVCLGVGLWLFRALAGLPQHGG